MSKYEVGQHVYIRSVNRAQNAEGTVAKVGRTLVYVQGPWGTPTAYRIETGVANNQFGHEHILTDDEMAAADRMSEVHKRWSAHGLRFDYGKRASVEVMEAIADLLDGVS